MSNGHFGIDDVSSYGWTPLALAASKNRVSMVKSIVGNGADISTSSPGNCTALHFAIVHHSIEDDELDENGTSYRIKDKLGRNMIL